MTTPDQTNTEPLFDCQAIGCNRPADYAYTWHGRDLMYVCEFHGGPDDAEGWTRITRGTSDAE